MDSPNAQQKRGRPSTLTPEVQERVLQAIRAGNYLETAASFAGVKAPTLREWLHRGRKPKAHHLYRNFVEEVEQAQAQAETRFTAIIATAAKDTWTAAAWWLERRYPDRWGRRERMEHTGAKGGPIEVNQVRHKLDTSIDELAERRSEKAS